VDVVDLVPGDLAPERMLRLLARVEVDRLRTDPLYAPAGAHEAVVLDPSVARRMTLESAPLHRGSLVRHTVAARRYAPGRTDIRIAPRLRAAKVTAAEQWRELDELALSARLFLDRPMAGLAFRTAHLASLLLGLVVAPGPALAALLAWSSQPAVALVGHRSGPDGAGARFVAPLRASLLRPLTTLVEIVALQSARGARTNADVPAVKPPPADELFEPRSATCPWCGSAALHPRLDSSDLIQFKPGTFHLDECGTCGHVFQNPRLSAAGLDYYYDEAYDGLGGEHAQDTFAGQGAAYEARLDAVAACTTPQRWLDVGAGYGHFCLMGRRRWPDARFDGLDMSESIAEAQRRGWIDRAHRGQFPDLAEEMPASYDVVSMNHYLEHTVDPRREVSAAARALVPGGHLLVEVPNAASRWTRLGRFWHGWWQPQHLHFFTAANLRAELEAQGFTVVSVDENCSEQAGTMTVGTILLGMTLAGPPRLPWLPPPSASRRLLRPLLLLPGLALLFPAIVADLFVNGWEKHQPVSAGGNAIRIVARRT
jgi:SAM-dependent methyltransferase